jgi:lipoate-protein ligase A
MRIYSLGEIGWKETQLLYHAMADLGHECVIICRSSSPYFCVGFHQAILQELEVRHLDSEGIPYFRRVTGGGTVRLDRDQVFYQIIMRRDNPEVPAHVEAFCERYLQPALKALEALGVKGRIVPPNDILVGDRKISGNGGGDIGQCKVLVGDLLVSFDVGSMVSGLKCPNDGFRETCRKTMEDNITTVGTEWPGTTVEEVVEALVEAYSGICDEGLGTEVPDEVLSKAGELEERMLSKDWLFFPGPSRPGRRVKVREGVHIAALEVEGQWLQFGISDVKLTGLEIPKGLAPDSLARASKDLSRLVRDMGVPKEMVGRIVEELIGNHTST